MGKPASDKTLLLAERRENKQFRQQINTLRIEMDHYRARATKAEQELADWKRRFDLLLARTPQLSGETK